VMLLDRMGSHERGLVEKLLAEILLALIKD
jgi:hypothetical protein